MVKTILIDSLANQVLNNILTEKNSSRQQTKTGLLIGTVRYCFIFLGEETCLNVYS